MSGLLEAGGSRVGEIANNTGMVMADHAEPAVDPRRCELVLSLLAKKWVIPILVELKAEPRRRQYLVTRLKVASSRLDPTIQEMTRWGLVERAWIPCGRTDGPAIAISNLGRSFLATMARLSEWQDTHHSELLDNDREWRSTHPDGQT